MAPLLLRTIRSKWWDEEELGTHRCFVAWAIPQREDKYLFEGTIWIDMEDYAIVKIAGHPAKRLSFWIEQADFVREYQKIGAFWFPSEDTTVVRVRLKGIKTLTIRHEGYEISSDVPNDIAFQETPPVTEQFVPLPTPAYRLLGMSAAGMSVLTGRYCLSRSS